MDLLIGLVIGVLLAAVFIGATIFLAIRKNTLKNSKKEQNQGVYEILNSIISLSKNMNQRIICCIHNNYFRSNK